MGTCWWNQVQLTSKKAPNMVWSLNIGSSRACENTLFHHKIWLDRPINRSWWDSIICTGKIMDRLNTAYIRTCLSSATAHAWQIWTCSQYLQILSQDLVQKAYFSLARERIIVIPAFTCNKFCQPPLSLLIDRLSHISIMGIWQFPWNRNWHQFSNDAMLAVSNDLQIFDMAEWGRNDTRICRPQKQSSILNSVFTGTTTSLTSNSKIL